MLRKGLYKQRTKQQGFTLIEILIALAIFTIMSMMAYAGLAAVLNARSHTVPRSEQLAQLQKTLYLLNEDLTQVIDRSIRDELGSQEPALGPGRGGEVLALTRTVPNWMNETTPYKLQRVSYLIEEGVLYRRVYDVVDRTQKTSYVRRKLLKTPTVILKQYDSLTQRWTPFNGGKMPAALDISFNLEGLGLINRSFIVRP